jgi:hypothetical protein
MQALSLAKECYSMKLDLLTNATVVSDAVKFVSKYNKKDNDAMKPSEELTEQESEDVTTTSTEYTTTNKVFE